MDITINNYQSIIIGKMKLQGLVGVVGKNNSGKTACMRALRDFMLNTFTKDKIHKKKKDGFIQVDGIKLERTTTSKLYLPGKEEPIENMNRKKTIDLIELNNFLLVQSEKINSLVIPQFSFQRTTLFPFNLPNNEIYQLFSLLFDLDILNQIFTLIKKKINDNNKELISEKGKLDLLLKESKKIKDQITNLPTPTDILHLKNEYEDLLLKKNTVLSYEKSLVRFYDLNRSFDNIVEQYNSLNERKIKLEKLLAFKVSIDSYLNLEETERIKLLRVSDIVLTIEKVEELLILLSKKNNVLSYENLIGDISVLENRLNTKSELIEKIEKLKVLYSLKTTILSYFILNNKIDEKEGIIKDKDESIFSIKNELKEFDNCPFCGSDKENWNKKF